MHCHQLGLAYGRETWVYPTNTLSATVTFLLLPRLRQGITTLATNLDGGLLSMLKRKNLATLESVWSAVFDHTQWKLCPCYKPIFDLPTEPNDSEPTQISQMSPTANSTNHFTASSIAPNKNPHFLGATSGETTTPP